MAKCIAHWTIILISIISNFSYGLLTTSIVPFEKENNRPKNCEFERAYKMDGYNCIRLELKEVPQHLKTSAKILDFSYNRIRHLTKSSFARYTSVKYLYLFENMILYIEEDTFAALTDLEAIDLSTNALRTIPMDLFRLPHLRNLRIAQNTLLDLAKDIEKLKLPIVAPLRELSLAECGLTAIPNFGILPRLHLFNLSSNPLHLDLTNTVLHFSSYCNLAILDLNETRMHGCTCVGLTRYLEKRGVRKIYSPCQISDMADYCGDVLNQTNQIAEPPAYYDCKKIVTTEELKDKSSLTWTTVFLLMFGFFVVFITVLYCMHRQNVKRIERKTKTGLPDSTMKVKGTIPNEGGVLVTENGHETLLGVDKS